MLANMTEAFQLWLHPKGRRPSKHAKWTHYDAFCAKLYQDVDTLRSRIKTVFPALRCMEYRGGMLVTGKGAKYAAAYFMRERYLDGIVDECFAPERVGNSYLLRMY